MRPDLFPEDYLKQRRDLRERARPFSAAEARAELEGALRPSSRPSMTSLFCSTGVGRSIIFPFQRFEMHQILPAMHVDVEAE